uniref:type II secretion system protein n=1 Tax=Candidatus Scatousia sp. TaxID=3085663 RepID=UPI004029BEED
MHKKAFTLAEVLITLGIIGIVAAMTLPTVVNKYQERVTVTKVKKFYSLINQALLFAIKDNGYVDEWDYIEYN